MTRRYAKAGFAAALLLFCVQLLAAPLLSCCGVLGVRAAGHVGMHNADAPGFEAMADADPGVSAIHAGHDSHVHHGDAGPMPAAPAAYPEAAPAPEFAAEADCEHQCNYCLGLSSTAMLEQRMQDLPSMTTGVLLTPLEHLPLDLSDPLLRPPRYS